jgi:uncharacterized protein YecE (DUF72 family)
MTRLWVGTSGYAFKEWRGSFYPEDLPAESQLRFYGERLPAVEINNTFYRLPKTSVLENWAAQVPEEFRFALKASQRITHIKRLRGAAEETSYLFRTVAVLGARLGPVLVGLPPSLKKDLPRFQEFLALLVEEDVTAPVAFEFRHPSWYDAEVLAALREHGRILCQADTDEAPLGELIASAPIGYLRLRREEYPDDELRRRLAAVRAQGWREAYVFFKHEDERGPAAARRLLDLAREA